MSQAMVKKPAKKRKPSETGIWRLTLDLDWGSRGARRNEEYYFRRKPTQAKVDELACGMPDSHISLTRLMCGKRYTRTSHH